MFINYNPSGTLEDGSKPSSAGILVDIQTLKEYKQQLTRTWWSECRNQKHKKDSR